ncbi:MAG: aminopeptidase [Frankiales bacterium]|nr:aminopeptidase [Frankiales bacterium]
MQQVARAAALLDAQAKAAQLFAAVEQQGLIRAGATELEVQHGIRDLAADLLGVERHWHKRIVRAGPNTLEPYDENPPDRVLADDDIVFLDFGPVFEQWEADFGRTYVLGDDPVKLQLRDDLAVVFAAGKRFFEERPDITGEALYGEVVRLSSERGWEFGNYHCGHLVGEFPHVTLDEQRTHNLITPGSDKPMRRPDLDGNEPHWILEVHLVDREREIGGFYEELLTL